MRLSSSSTVYCSGYLLILKSLVGHDHDSQGSRVKHIVYLSHTKELSPTFCFVRAVEHSNRLRTWDKPCSRIKLQHKLKKNNIHQNISQVCHDSLRRRKLSLSVFYQVQVLLKYISSYNVSLIKRTIIYHWKRRQQYTHKRAVRTCFIFKCQYQVSMYTTMGRGTTLS